MTNEQAITFCGYNFIKHSISSIDISPGCLKVAIRLHDDSRVHFGAEFSDWSDSEGMKAKLECFLSELGYLENLFSGFTWEGAL